MLFPRSNLNKGDIMTKRFTLKAIAGVAALAATVGYTGLAQAQTKLK